MQIILEGWTGKLASPTAVPWPQLPPLFSLLHFACLKKFLLSPSSYFDNFSPLPRPIISLLHPLFFPSFLPYPILILNSSTITLKEKWSWQRQCKYIKGRYNILWIFGGSWMPYINVLSTILWKRYYVDVLKGELNSTSTYVPAQLKKDTVLLRHIDALTKINIKIDKCELPTFYLLPKLHKNPFKSLFIFTLIPFF